MSGFDLEGMLSPRRSARAPRTLVLLLALVASACGSPAAKRSDVPKVAAQVTAALRAFEAAERTRDPDAVLHFLAEDFAMLQDGVRVDRAATVAQIHATLPTLRAFEPRFDEVEVRVLAPDAALTSMIFHDVITDASGATTRMWGPSTLLWRLEDGAWRVAFADSDHYPGSPGSPGE